MQFLGPITPGGPDVALSGTAKEIYEQILKLNPAYDVFDFPAYAEDLESQGITRENLDSPNPEVFSRNPAVAARDVLAKRDNVRTLGLIFSKRSANDTTHRSTATSAPGSATSTHSAPRDWPTFADSAKRGAVLLRTAMLA